MISDIKQTISAFLSAFSYARKYNLFPFLWLSGIISLILGCSIFLLAYGVSDNLEEFLISCWKWEWGSGIVHSISGILSGLMLGVLGLFLYKYSVLIVIGPIMSPLSERLEEGLLGKSDGEKLSIARLLQEMLRGVRLALRNIVRELFYTLMLLLLSFIPGIALVTTPAIYLVQSYYLGFGNMDYYLERHYGVQDSVAFVKRYKWIAISNGGLFIITLFIPIIGLFLAPFLCTIAVTVVCIERDII
jgi:CysZ protein